MTDSTQYWAFRIDTRVIDYIDAEARKGRLRQGWGWLDGQDLNLPPEDFVDQGAGKNRRMLKVKKGDVILVPRIPEWSQVSIFMATEDWRSGYYYEEAEQNEWGDYRHVFPVEFERSFGRHDSHVSGDIRSTLKTPSRFWNIDWYAEAIKDIRETVPGDVKKDQESKNRLRDAIQKSFDQEKFEKDVSKEINRQFSSAEWEPVLMEVLQQLYPHFHVDKTGGKSEQHHGTDILMTLKPGPLDESQYGIAIQIKDWDGEVGKEVIDQIKSATYWEEERGLAHIEKVVIATNATREQNESLIKEAKKDNIRLVFKEELDPILARYAAQKITEMND